MLKDLAALMPEGSTTRKVLSTLGKSPTTYQVGKLLSSLHADMKTTAEAGKAASALTVMEQQGETVSAGEVRAAQETVTPQTVSPETASPTVNSGIDPQRLTDAVAGKTRGKVIDARRSATPQTESTLSPAESQRITDAVNGKTRGIIDTRRSATAASQAQTASTDSVAELLARSRAGLRGERYVPQNTQYELSSQDSPDSTQHQDLFVSMAPDGEESASQTYNKPYTIYYIAGIGSARSRSAHRNRANRSFYEKMSTDGSFKKQMDLLLGYDVMSYMRTGKGALKNPSPDWVWHHPPESALKEQLELITRKDHTDKQKQTILHPGENRKGGYALNF